MGGRTIWVGGRLPTAAPRRFFQHVGGADPGGELGARGGDCPFLPDVAQTQRHGVHVERGREAVDLVLGGKMALWPAKTAKCAAGAVVGVDGAGVDQDVGNVIGAKTGHQRIAQDFGAGIGIGPGVAGHIHLCGDDLAVTCCAPFGLQNVGVALVMPDDALFTRPHDFHRSPCLDRRQRQNDLHRNIFAPAKGPPDGGMAHHHLVVGNTESVGNLLAFFVHPLARTNDLDATIGPHKAQSGFGLQIGMFLRLGTIGRFDNDIGLRKAGLDVAIREGIAVQHVGMDVTLAIGEAKLVGVENGRVGLHGGKRVGHDGQRVIVHLDEFGRGLG